MNNKLIKFIGLLQLIAVTLFLAGCSGLPDSQVRKAKNIPERLAQQEAVIAKSRAYLAGLKSSGDWQFLQPYQEKENWSGFISNAVKELDDARSLYNTEILVMLDRDDPEDSIPFQDLLNQFDAHLSKSSQYAGDVRQRTDFLIRVRDTATEIHDQANVEYNQIQDVQNVLTTKANNSIKKYPHKKDDIEVRLNTLADIVKKGEHAVSNVNTEYSKSAGRDYALLGDESLKVTRALQDVQRYARETAGKLDELDRSYVKILADQRIDYYVVIGRANWCESDWCGEGAEIRYPATKVDEGTFEYFDALNINVIATNRPGWGGDKFKIYIPSSRWKALGIDPKWRWTDNYADYWVDNTYANTFHKYIEVVDNQMKETAWVKVDESSFWNQYDNLGMAILTKPYGMYEEEALSKAQPAGMAAIATPTMVNGRPEGANRYGEWRHENGLSFWHYYGMYAVFRDVMIPGRYSYNDWSGYRRAGRGKPYYGQEEEYGTFGSGTYSSSRYGNSDYAKRNPGQVKAARTGKYSRTDSSIRGVGASSRSRGPAGGGK